MATNFYNNPSFSESPYGLKLQQTITSSGSVTGIPSSVKRVYAVCIGGGGGGGTYVSPLNYRVTAISGDGTTMTYTSDNNLVAGMQVTVLGSSIAGYNVTNAAIASATSTQFTVTGTTTGTPTLTDAYASARTVTTGAVAGGLITSVTPSSPATGQVTYATTAIVPVGVNVNISGATPSGYNGTKLVISSVPGTSFTVSDPTTGAASGTITFSGVVTFTAANNYSISSLIIHSNHTPSSYNLTSSLVVDATSTTYTVANPLTYGTTWTSGGNSTFSNSTLANAGGGGAGGYSAGWTTVPSTCTVGAGGAGGQMNLAFTGTNSNVQFNNPNGRGAKGGDTRFGTVIAGGGGGGAGSHGNITIPTSYGGATGGGSTTATSAIQSSPSFTGAPAGVSGSAAYAGAGGGSGSAGTAGVSGGGGGGHNSSMLNASPMTGRAGGAGLIGGGGGSALSLFGTTGGAGGNGDRFAGGTGSNGTGVLFGAGGGGGGYAGAGGNASGNNGGAGGAGGGGGGAGCNFGTGGAGGNGVIYLYY